MLIPLQEVLILIQKYHMFRFIALIRRMCNTKQEERKEYKFIKKTCIWEIDFNLNSAR